MQCFYCFGEHETSQCISWATDEISSTIDELGYKTIDQLNEMTHKIERVGYKVDRVGEVFRNAVLEFSNVFRLAHAETIWHMEKEIELLTGINDMMQNPRATQSNELYNMSAECLKAGRANDSLPLLEEAKKLNPLDYRVHIMMGHAHLQRDDVPNAIECFLAARDYARTKEYKKDALLLIGRGYHCLNQRQNAIQFLEEALDIMPDDPQVCYELSGVSEKTRALKLLRKAIVKDRKFFVLAKADKQFDTRRNQVDALLERLYDEARTRAEHAIADAESPVKTAAKWFRDNRFFTKLNEAKERFATHSYFGYLDAIPKAKELGAEALANYEESKHVRALYLENSRPLIDYLNGFFEFLDDIRKYRNLKSFPSDEKYNYLKQIFDTIVKESKKENYPSYEKFMEKEREALELVWGHLQPIEEELRHSIFDDPWFMVKDLLSLTEESMRVYRKCQEQTTKFRRTMKRLK